jgi:O-antigen ligase
LRSKIEVSVETLRSIQLWLTIAVLGLAPLFFGSVDPFWVVTWTILLSGSALCGMMMPLDPGQSRVVAVFLALCCAYALVAVIQVVPQLLSRLDDPIWQRANDLLGLGIPPRISGRAEIPPAAIGHFLLLTGSFLSGLFAGTSRRNSDVLFTFARWAILIYAMYGLLALALTPNLVLWAPKLAYRGYLTATFVNHNTAATFVGAGAILWCCWTYLSLQSFRYSSFRLLLLTPSNEQLAFKLVFRAAAGLICFLALLLTGSRGGLICTCFGLLAAIGLLLAGKLRPTLSHVLAAGGVTIAVIVIWLSQTGRIGSQGVLDNGRWFVYVACIDAILQRPLLGAGAGTFADLFPSLRPDDISTWGVWEYAHSTILEIAVEMGLPIAILVAIAAGASLFILGRAALKSTERSQSLLAAITGIAVLSYLHAMIDFSFQIPGYLIVFGIMMGCGLARATAEQEPSRATRSGVPISIKQEPRRRGVQSEALEKPPAGPLSVS